MSNRTVLALIVLLSGFSLSWADEGAQNSVMEIGSLEKGKRADMITVSLDGPHAVPIYSVYSQFAYVLKGSDVRDVVINGKVLVRNRVALTLDQAAIVKMAAEYGGKVQRSLR